MASVLMMAPIASSMCDSEVGQPEEQVRSSLSSSTPTENHTHKPLDPSQAAEMQHSPLCPTTHSSFFQKGVCSFRPIFLNRTVTAFTFSATTWGFLDVEKNITVVCGGIQQQAQKQQPITITSQFWFKRVESALSSFYADNKDFRPLYLIKWQNLGLNLGLPGEEKFPYVFSCPIHMRYCDSKCISVWESLDNDNSIPTDRDVLLMSGTLLGETGTNRGLKVGMTKGIWKLFIFYDDSSELCVKAYVLNMAPGRYRKGIRGGFVFDELINDAVKWSVHCTSVAHIETLADLQFPECLKNCHNPASPSCIY